MKTARGSRSCTINDNVIKEGMLRAGLCLATAGYAFGYRKANQLDNREGMRGNYTER